MKSTEKKQPQFLSAENLNCQRIGAEAYLFTVDGCPNYRLIVDDQFDLANIETDNLIEMEIQMGYNGDMDCTCGNGPRQIGQPFCQREAKFSKTRKRIGEEIERREAGQSV